MNHPQGPAVGGRTLPGRPGMRLTCHATTNTRSDMKSTRAKLLLGSLLPGIIAMAVAPAVYARSIAAYAGNPLQNKARTCFTESNGAVQAGLSNTNCPGVWEVNLPVDTAGSYTVSYTGLVT